MNVLKTNNRFASLLEDTRTRQVRVPAYKNKFNPDSKMNNTSINMNDFPLLISTRINPNICTDRPNYMSKLQHQPNIEPEKVDLLPYGWVVITPTKYNHPKNPSINSYRNPSCCMDSFVKLYNKRKDDYIAMWGLETYENVFLFPNYDYDYFEDDDDDEENEEYYDEYYGEYYN